jgi:hypothetical protein
MRPTQNNTVMAGLRAASAPAMTVGEFRMMCAYRRSISGRARIQRSGSLGYRAAPFRIVP